MSLLTWMSNLSTGGRLVTRRELVTLSPADLLRRSRSLAQAVYVGEDTVLCRVLGRYRIYVAASDVGFGVHVMLDGAWETWLTSFMARRIRSGMTIVDAGANHGYYSLLFAHLTGPEGRVAAIEPHPRTAALLRRSLYANGFQSWATVFEMAATAEDNGQAQLLAPEHEPKNAFLGIEAALPGAAAFHVKTGRLATLLADWPRIDFIKADVEGGEEGFIEGGWPLLERDRPDMVLEFNALRCKDPTGLLTRLKGLYGRVQVIGTDGRLSRVPRAVLADASLHKDWMLFCSRD